MLKSLAKLSNILDSNKLACLQLIRVLLYENSLSKSHEEGYLDY